MKWLFRGVLALVCLVLLAVVALFLIPTDRVARLAADRFAAATGRTLTIDGPVHATLWPRLGVRAERIAVANADWSEEGPMLSAASLDVGVALGPLLGGDIRIESLDVDGARLILERRADGTGNWEVAQASDAPDATATDGGGGAPRGFSIDRAALTGTDVTWIDHAASSRIELRAVDLETRLDGWVAPLRIDASGLLNGQAITVALSTDALGSLLDGTLTAVSASVESGATTLAANGRADLDPLSFEGEVEVHSTDRFNVLQAFGADLSALPDGFGAASVDLTAAMTLAPAGTLHLRDMIANLDENRLTGAVDLDPTGDRPRIAATLAATSLDLPMVGGAGPDAADGADPGWSSEAIDVSALFSADADVTLETGPVTAGEIALDELRARIALEDGRAVVTLQPLIAYGGTVTGDVVVNARGGLSARATLDLSGLGMQPLLTAFAGTDRLTGRADMSVDLLGSGASVQALVSSLDGALSLSMGEGEILGLDIPGMIRTLDLSYRGEGQKTIFEGLSASFDVTGGVARGDDLSLAAPYLTATGAGDIDLGARTVSYRLIPTVRREEDGTGLTVPISIEGPWSGPRIRPDLEYLAREKLEAERDALAARATDAAREKLAEELDVAPEVLGSRESIEDAIADRVRNELGNLLNRN